MNNVRRAIVMDCKQLLRYKEFLLNITTKPRTHFYTSCCDDCNGSCMNRKYTPMLPPMLPLPPTPPPLLPLLPLMLTQYK